jgi:hypothetical protein
MLRVVREVISILGSAATFVSCPSAAILPSALRLAQSLA